MAKRVLEDTSKDGGGGVYHLDRIAAVVPAPIKGDRTDQTKVTHINTILHTAGGAVLHTAIPFEVAKQAALDAWNDVAPAPAEPPKA